VTTILQSSEEYKEYNTIDNEVNVCSRHGLTTPSKPHSSTSPEENGLRQVQEYDDAHALQHQASRNPNQRRNGLKRKETSQSALLILVSDTQ